MSVIIFGMLYCKLVSRSGTYLIMKNYIFFQISQTDISI